MAIKHPVLLVDDDFTASSMLQSYLEQKGPYQVNWVKDGDQGLKSALEERFDCIILDINLPGVNGFEILRKIRDKGMRTQVLITSVRGREDDIVMGLELGADDYLIKPFQMGELLARLKARIRRSLAASGQYRSSQKEWIDFDDLVIYKGDRQEKLTAREARLLKLLLENQGRVLSREQILDHVWGIDYLGTSRTVDNFVLALRKKMEGVEGVQIETVRGMGYRILTQSSQEL